MNTGARANEILINGYGCVKTVRDAKQIAETAKALGNQGLSRFVDATVVLSEALKEAEVIILQFTEKARQFDIVMAELKTKAKKGK